MGKAQPAMYALKVGHKTQFRRTITIGKGKNEQKVQLVFEPDTPYEITDQELVGLKQDIANGMIVKWEAGNRRLRPTGAATAEQSATIQTLRDENTALKEQVAELTDQVAELTEPDDASELQDSELGEVAAK